MTIATVSSKGQITLPAEMRRKLGIGLGKRVVIRMDRDSIRIMPSKDIFELEGFLGDALGEDLENRAVADHISQRQVNLNS